MTFPGKSAPYRLPRRSHRSRLCCLSLAVLALGSTTAGGGCGARYPVTAMRATMGATATATVGSNIRRQDYAGSAACAPCHAEVVAAWNHSPMHRMTRMPETAEIRAPFDGREFRFKGDVARFEQVSGARFMRLVSPDRAPRVYRVTKVIGGRYREDFAGIEVASADPAAPPVGDPRRELLLPVSYVFQNASFRLKGYSVMVGERPGLRAGGVWSQTCIFCHNTVPYFDDLWGALYGPGAPGYQGEVVDRVLPRDRRMRYGVTDPRALIQAVDDEMGVLGQSASSSSGSDVPVSGVPAGLDEDPRRALRRAMTASRARFGPEHFVEIGIGCESCHGGSREHVDNPHLHPTFQPRAAFLSVDAPPGANAPVSPAEWQNRACARCHQVLFSRYARTWEGGSRRAPESAGGSHITSGEARDFLLGACSRTMACTACHDPHGEDRRDAIARLATPAGNVACTGCHPALAAPAALQAHAHHDPMGAGGACVACHMPRKNMGLGYALTRYHRIGSPTDAARVEGDRPLECALCHADKTVAAVLGDMTRLWGKHYDPATMLRLYGSLDANVLIATIERGYAHEQAAAMGAASERHFLPAARAIERQVEANPYPLVRYYAAAARAAIAGQPVPANPGADANASHGTSPPGPVDSDADED